MVRYMAMVSLTLHTLFFIHTIYNYKIQFIHHLWWEVDRRVIVTSEARSEENIMMMHRHKMSIIVTWRSTFLSKCVRFKVGQCKSPNSLWLHFPFICEPPQIRNPIKKCCIPATGSDKSEEYKNLRKVSKGRKKSSELKFSNIFSDR